MRPAVVQSILRNERRNASGSCNVEKCNALWRKVQLEVKMLKLTIHSHTLGGKDAEKVHTAWRVSTCRSQNVKSIPGSDHFWKSRDRYTKRQKDRQTDGQIDR